MKKLEELKVIIENKNREELIHEILESNGFVISYLLEKKVDVDINFLFEDNIVNLDLISNIAIILPKIKDKLNNKTKDILLTIFSIDSSFYDQESVIKSLLPTLYSFKEGGAKILNKEEIFFTIGKDDSVLKNHDFKTVNLFDNNVVINEEKNSVYDEAKDLLTVNYFDEYGNIIDENIQDISIEEHDEMLDDIPFGKHIDENYKPVIKKEANVEDSMKKLDKVMKSVSLVNKTPLEILDEKNKVLPTNRDEVYELYSDYDDGGVDTSGFEDYLSKILQSNIEKYKFIDNAKIHKEFKALFKAGRRNHENNFTTNKIYDLLDDIEVDRFKSLLDLLEKQNPEVINSLFLIMLKEKTSNDSFGLYDKINSKIALSLLNNEKISSVSRAYAEFEGYEHLKNLEAQMFEHIVDLAALLFNENEDGEPVNNEDINVYFYKNGFLGEIEEFDVIDEAIELNKNKATDSEKMDFLLRVREKTSNRLNIYRETQEFKDELERRLELNQIKLKQKILSLVYPRELSSNELVEVKNLIIEMDNKQQEIYNKKMNSPVCFGLEHNEVVPLAIENKRTIFDNDDLENSILKEAFLNIVDRDKIYLSRYDLNFVISYENISATRERENFASKNYYKYLSFGEAIEKGFWNAVFIDTKISSNEQFSKNLKTKTFNEIEGDIAKYLKTDLSRVVERFNLVELLNYIDKNTDILIKDLINENVGKRLIEEYFVLRQHMNKVKYTQEYVDNMKKYEFSLLNLDYENDNIRECVLYDRDIKTLDEYNNDFEIFKKNIVDDINNLYKFIEDGNSNINYTYKIIGDNFGSSFQTPLIQVINELYEKAISIKDTNPNYNKDDFEVISMLAEKILINRVEDDRRRKSIFKYNDEIVNLWINYIKEKSISSFDDNLLNKFNIYNNSMNQVTDYSIKEKLENKVRDDFIKLFALSENGAVVNKQKTFKETISYFSGNEIKNKDMTKLIDEKIALIPIINLIDLLGLKETILLFSSIRKNKACIFCINSYNSYGETLLLVEKLKTAKIIDDETKIGDLKVQDFVKFLFEEDKNKEFYNQINEDILDGKITSFNEIRENYENVEFPEKVFKKKYESFIQGYGKSSSAKILVGQGFWKDLPFNESVRSALYSQRELAFGKIKFVLDNEEDSIKYGLETKENIEYYKSLLESAIDYQRLLSLKIMGKIKEKDIKLNKVLNIEDCLLGLIHRKNPQVANELNAVISEVFSQITNEEIINNPFNTIPFSNIHLTNQELVKSIMKEKLKDFDMGYISVFEETLTGKSMDELRANLMSKNASRDYFLKYLCIGRSSNILKNLEPKNFPEPLKDFELSDLSVKEHFDLINSLYSEIYCSQNIVELHNVENICDFYNISSNKEFLNIFFTKLAKHISPEKDYLINNESSLRTFIMENELMLKSSEYSDQRQVLDLLWYETQKDLAASVITPKIGDEIKKYLTAKEEIPDYLDRSDIFDTNSTLPLKIKFDIVDNNFNEIFKAIKVRAKRSNDILKAFAITDLVTSLYTKEEFEDMKNRWLNEKDPVKYVILFTMLRKHIILEEGRKFIIENQDKVVFEDLTKASLSLIGEALVFNNLYDFDKLVAAVDKLHKMDMSNGIFDNILYNNINDNGSYSNIFSSDGCYGELLKTASNSNNTGFIIDSIENNFNLLLEKISKYSDFNFLFIDKIAEIPLLKLPYYQNIKGEYFDKSLFELINKNRVLFEKNLDGFTTKDLLEEIFKDKMSGDITSEIKDFMNFQKFVENNNSFSSYVKSFLDAGIKVKDKYNKIFQHNNEEIDISKYFTKIENFNCYEDVQKYLRAYELSIKMKESKKENLETKVGKKKI